MSFKQGPGFTLVELVIVLVTVGILMRMIVKGKNLIQSARLKAEIVKIRSINMAFFFYVNDNNGAKPPLYGTNNSYYRVDTLITREYVTNKQLYSEIGNWYYIPRHLCEYNSNPTLAGTSAGYVSTFFGTNCGPTNITNDWLAPTTNANTSPSTGLASWYDLCTISSAIEGGPNMGNERFLRTYAFDNSKPTIADFSNCNSNRQPETFYVSIDYGVE